MALTPEQIQELSRILDARSGRGRSERPKLRLVVPPTPKLLDAISRNAHLRRILHLKRAYQLDWLVDQESFGVASVSCLEDCDLVRLLNLMEHARECIVDGISFEDAGLVRSLRSEEAAGRTLGHHYAQSELNASTASINLEKISRTLQTKESSSDPPF